MITTTTQSTPDQYQIMLSNYADIVEKTNQQLGLWTNPYGLMIGLLTIIIAIVAIIVSVLLWKNSRDQKKRIDDFFDRQEEDIKTKREAFDGMLKKREVKLDEYEKDLDNLIADYEKELKSANKANKTEIKRLKDNIDELTKSKASLGSYRVPEAIDVFGTFYPSTYGFINPIKETNCFGCGKKFQYKDKDGGASWATTLSLNPKNKKVYCPHCSAENYI